MSDETYLNADALHQQLESIIKTSRTSRVPNTGFFRLDRLQSLYPGLYCLGAAPGIGRTTLLLQIADQIAEQNAPVLYFSASRKPYELYAKSLSRMSWQRDPKTAVSATEIISGSVSSDTLDDLKIMYTEKTNSLVHFDPHRCFGIPTMQNAITAFQKEFRNYPDPVIFIDGLDSLDPRFNSSPNDTIRKIRDMQQDKNLAVFLSCPFDPEKSKGPASMASFACSMAVASNADVVWALDTDSLEQLTGNIPAGDLPMELKILKNAYGPMDVTDYFTYHTAYSMFEEE